MLIKLEQKLNEPKFNEMDDTASQKLNGGC